MPYFRRSINLLRRDEARLEFFDPSRQLRKPIRKLRNVDIVIDEKPGIYALFDAPQTYFDRLERVSTGFHQANRPNFFPPKPKPITRPVRDGAASLRANFGFAIKPAKGVLDLVEQAHDARRNLSQIGAGTVDVDLSEQACDTGRVRRCH